MKWNSIARVHVPDRVKDRYDAVCRAIFLLLCFLVPVQPLMPIKTYRLVEALILVLGAATYAIFGAVRFPSLIRWSFWIGLGGWIVSTGFSSNILRSMDVGILEYVVFYVMFYLAVIHLRERRDLVRAIILFGMGAAIIAITQTVTIIATVQKETPFPLPTLPLTASEFLRYKAALPQAFPQGVPNGYGNVDGYASLCAMLLPGLLGLLYVSRQRMLVLALFLVHAYASLIVYSRGTVLVVVTAICALWLFRLRAYRQLSPVICAVLLATVLIHADDKVVSSFGGGVMSFLRSITGRPAVPEVASNHAHKFDNSPVERAQALSTGVSIGFESTMIGIGYGIYPTVDTVLTSPHSLAVLRFAEGGILSAIAFAMLVIYAPWCLLQVLKNAEKDMLEAACLCAATAFLAKAVMFGANFSVSSNFVWGLGMALCLTGSLCGRQEQVVVQGRVQSGSA